MSGLWIGPHQLTKHQTTIARMIVNGMTTEQIARSLSVEQGTITGHLGRMYTLLGVHDRGQFTDVIARNDVYCDHCQRRASLFRFIDLLYERRLLQLCDDPPHYCWTAAHHHEQELLMDEIGDQMAPMGIAASEL